MVSSVPKPWTNNLISLEVYSLFNGILILIEFIISIYSPSSAWASKINSFIVDDDITSNDRKTNNIKFIFFIFFGLEFIRIW